MVEVATCASNNQSHDTDIMQRQVLQLGMTFLDQATICCLKSSSWVRVLAANEKITTVGKGMREKCFLSQLNIMQTLLSPCPL